MRVCLTLLLAVASFVRAQISPTAVDKEATARLEQDFVAFNPHYKQELELRIARTKTLAKRLFEEEATGGKTTCGHQILFETESLLISSADFKPVDQRLSELEQSISHPSSDHADGDGLWGACYTQWYLKLYATYDHFESRAGEDPPPHPFPKFLSRVSTPERLIAYLDALSISDVRRTGVDREREFNETLATLLQIIVRRKPENYIVDPALRGALLDRVLHRYRNPQTGFWGERYLRGGREDFPDDLSLTFHVVSYLKGNVPDMPRLLDTALALKDLDYPTGWLWKGQYWNHNNMDVATLFRYGWNQASDVQRKTMTAEIDRMLDWCLKESLQPDGSFKVNIADGSVEDAEYYGTSFLARVGFFDPGQRFWTNRDFPNAAEVKGRIISFVRSHESTGPTGDHYRSTLEALGVR